MLNSISNLEAPKDKFYPRSQTEIFVGYSNVAKAYCVWSPKKRCIEIVKNIMVNLALE